MQSRCMSVQGFCCSFWKISVMCSSLFEKSICYVLFSFWKISVMCSPLFEKSLCYVLFSFWKISVMCSPLFEKSLLCSLLFLKNPYVMLLLAITSSSPSFHIFIQFTLAFWQKNISQSSKKWRSCVALFEDFPAHLLIYWFHSAIWTLAFYWYQ